MAGKDTILKYALQNAVFYGGKANAGAVIGKVIADAPELKKDMKSLGREVAKAVAEVNRLKPDEQKRKLESIDSSLLERKEKVQEPLPPLEGAKDGKVITRFAPAPTGPLHIMHVLRALGLSYEYARKYRGKFILRFEDTDPKKVDRDAYGWIKDDMKRLGYECDSVVLESEHMADYYGAAEGLIRGGQFYVCSCDSEKFRKLKLEEKDCPCRKNGTKENVRRWAEMLKGKDGMVVRFRTSMSDPNPALRDPPMLRVSNDRHALTGTKFHVWPLYNFANTIEDHMQGVTHVFRGKEHEHNTAVQDRLYAALGWKPPATINFGMLKLATGKMHKRDIRKMMSEGKLGGWDDASLPTVRSMLRRGYQPAAIRQAVFMAGLSKNDITFNMESLDAENRKLIDPTSNRYSVVIDPMKLEISGIDADRVRVPVHPDFPDRGERTIPVDPKKIYVSGEDFRKFNGKVVRLRGLCNIRMAAGCRCIDNENRPELQKIQWVSEPNVRVELVRPEGNEVGLGEPEMQKAGAGETVQLERVGFGRVDSVGKGKVIVYFAHK
jgi:glutamyl-tRNA synthetase